MATATATRSVAATVIASGAASHGIAALALKLQHPLVRIRARALANLLFKLRERLVDMSAEPRQAIDALMRELVASLTDRELEPSVLQVLQLLLLDATAGETTTRACADALRRHGAAAAFQRGSVARGTAVTADIQPTYEVLLHRLLATSSALQEELRTSPTPSLAQSLPMSDASDRRTGQTSPETFSQSIRDSSHASAAVRAAHATVSAVANAQRTSQKGAPSDPLTSHGWRFPRVALAAVDDQFLFEFEVKWRLRTTIPELVEMCDTFRRELLRDFPPEVFLQRPAILLRVLELVRQPIVPAATTPELSFGVNYFDEPASRASFVWKPSVQATALHMATLKAIESWLAAMRHSMAISLNPMYHTFPSSASSNGLIVSTTGFDHRRLHYPRVEDREDIIEGDGESGLSLGGAAYLTIATLMRLLSSELYSHLHLLNVIHVVTEFLPERSSFHRGDEVNPLDKMRLENLFAVLAEVVLRPPNGHDSFVHGRIVEWLLLVLQLLPPSRFRVEGTSTTQNSELSTRIEVPLVLWDWILHQIASGDGVKDGTMRDAVQFLDQIDPSASNKLAKIMRSSEDAIQLAAALRNNSHPPTLQQAHHVLQVLSSLSEQQRSGAGRVVLEAICGEFEQVATGGETPSSTAVNDVLIQIVSLISQNSAPLYQAFAVRVLDGLIDWIPEDTLVTPDRRLEAVMSIISGSEEFLHIFLCSLAGSECSATGVESLWRLAELVFQAFEHKSGASSMKVFATSVALMQHLAYFDPSISTINEAHRRLQRTLMHLVHEAEAALPEPGQLLMIARCLVHQSAFVRRAAASGLLERLDHLGLERLRRMPRSSMVAVDPFGQFDEGNGDTKRRVVEHEITLILHPRASSGEPRRDDSSNSVYGSSILHRVSRLRKLLSSLLATGYDVNSAQSAAASTLQQLLIDLVHASTIDFGILEEAGEVEELMHVSLFLLPRHESDEPNWFHCLRASTLSIVRVLLTRSAQWRKLVRQDQMHLGDLLSFAFDEEPRVRAEAYFIVIALACSMETVMSKVEGSDLVLPSQFSSTFGLFSSRWSTSGISLQDIVSAMEQYTPSGAKELPVMNEFASNNSTIGESLQRLWDDLLTAKSYRTFLDALYSVTQACHARNAARTIVSDRWEESPFRRYLETVPTSAKDQVIVAAILAMQNVLFDSMSTDQQMNVVLLLRHKIVPLLLRDEYAKLSATALPMEVARLLLRISRSKVSDMFVPLLVDTGLLKKLGPLIVASGVSGTSMPSQQTLWIQVALAACEQTNLADDDAPQRQQILDAVRTQLEAIAGRHQAPGSFQGRDVSINAVSGLVKLRSVDNDAVWRTRLLFDSASHVRSAGFQVATSGLGNDDRESTGKILRLAVDTMREDTECDAVRSSAANLLFEFYRRVEREALSLYGSNIDWDKFVPDLIRDLVSPTRAKSKCTVRLDLSCMQLLRLFISHPDRFADSPGGNVLDHIISDSQEDSRALTAIVERLSIRRAFESYQHHCIEFLGMQPDKVVWIRSLLPVVLRTVSEASQLLRAIYAGSLSHGPCVLQAMPYVLQLVETIADITKLLDNVEPGDSPTTQLYYDALDQCGKLLASVLSINAAVSLPTITTTRLLHGIAVLLDPVHPWSFRLSFARVVPALLCCCRTPEETISPTDMASLGTNLWSAYTELCELQPMDPTATHRRTASFLQQLRRVAYALGVLLSHSQDASSAICGRRHGAVPLIIQAIKKSFSAIRLIGGFGAKSTKGSDEGFALELCDAIQLHCQVLSGLFVHSRQAQSLARAEQLPSVFANNWNIIRAAYRKGSGVLVGALRLLQNFIHANDANKTSLAVTIATTMNTRAPPTAGGDNERNLLAMIGELALGRSASVPFDERCSLIAGSILKSAFLHVDCLHSAIKTGLVSNLFASVVGRSRRRRETSKAPSPLEEQTLIELFGVLASVASLDEGQQIVLQLRELSNLLDDIFHFPEGSKLSVFAALFVRNLAFSKFSKSHFSVWEPLIDRILAQLYRWGSDNSTRPARDALREVAADHLSTALVCLVRDNQRAQSVIQSSRNAMLLLRDGSRAWQRLSKISRPEASRRAVTVSDNLERVLLLITSDGDAVNSIDGP